MGRSQPHHLPLAASHGLWPDEEQKLCAVLDQIIAAPPVSGACWLCLMAYAADYGQRGRPGTGADAMGCDPRELRGAAMFLECRCENGAAYAARRRNLAGSVSRSGTTPRTATRRCAPCPTVSGDRPTVSQANSLWRT